MADVLPLVSGSCETARHWTSWVEAGPPDGPLMVFLHGWPEIGLLWKRQLQHFGARGWRCVVPDMRGYGDSSVPDGIASYLVEEITLDIVELHGAPGGEPAVWGGHDWGAPIAWAVASHHRARCRGVVGLSVPYLARGFALPTLLPLIDRATYPKQDYPVGQWDYWLHYRERVGKAARSLGRDVADLFSMLYRPGTSAAAGEPAITSGVRARGGWFGTGELPPADPAGTILPAEEFSALVMAFSWTGFAGANA